MSMSAVLPNTPAAERPLDAAIAAWREAIGDARVVENTAPYAVDTSSFTSRIPVALRPACVRHVQDVVRIAQQFAVPLYPVSTGRNWGYGTAVPVRSPGVVVDLSSMNRIIGFDAELGVVTLEPGVTQGQLRAWLDSRGAEFLVPVTGAGPSCSVLANALERGFGVTPVTDHFGAIVSLKAVLPDGQIYESYTRNFAASGVGQAYKWGTGPYLDGLFSQSNLGVVVDASIALQPKAERCGVLLFTFHATQEVEEATGAIRELLSAAGQNIGAINVMSRSRVECMLGGSKTIAERVGAAPGCHNAGMPPGAWFGFGSVYGTREHYRATRRLVARCLRGRARQVRVYGGADIRRLRWLGSLAAKAALPKLAGMAARLEAALGIVEGVPSKFALPLAYAKSGRPVDKEDWNPARDGCGLLWYSPLVPLRSGVVERFINFTEQTCGSHGLLAPITLTTLSARCYASTIPLLFDRADADAERRAFRCFEELYEKGLDLGFTPYRMGAPFMPALNRGASGSAPLVRALKGALDPNRVLAPGRYSFD